MHRPPYRCRAGVGALQRQDRLAKVAIHEVGHHPAVPESVQTASAVEAQRPDLHP